MCQSLVLGQYPPDKITPDIISLENIPQDKTLLARGILLKDDFIQEDIGGVKMSVGILLDNRSGGWQDLELRF